MRWVYGAGRGEGERVAVLTGVRGAGWRLSERVVVLRCVAGGWGPGRGRVG
jgi:hypothetical protein